MCGSHGHSRKEKVLLAQIEVGRGAEPFVFLEDLQEAPALHWAGILISTQFQLQTWTLAASWAFTLVPRPLPSSLAPVSMATALAGACLGPAYQRTVLEGKHITTGQLPKTETRLGRRGLAGQGAHTAALTSPSPIAGSV